MFDYNDNSEYSKESVTVVFNFDKYEITARGFVDQFEEIEDFSMSLYDRDIGESVEITDVNEVDQEIIENLAIEKIIEEKHLPSLNL